MKLYCLLLLFISQSLFAQDFDVEKMDALFTKIEDNQKGMGSISIFKNGQEVYQTSTGYADVEKGVRATSRN